MVIVNNSVGVFLSSKRDLEVKKRDMGSHPALGLTSLVGPSFTLSVISFSPPLFHLGLGIKMDF